jgi:hypothetical protein
MDDERDTAGMETCPTEGEVLNFQHLFVINNVGRISISAEIRGKDEHG